MKYLSIIILILLSATSLYAQRQWSEWETVYQEGSSLNEVKVQVSFKVSVCDGENLRGYSFYRTNNEFKREKSNVSFKFDYLDCKGEIGTAIGSVDLSTPGINDYIGKWFLGRKVLQIYDIKYKDFNANRSATRSVSGSSSVNNSSANTSPSDETAAQTEEEYTAKVTEGNILFNLGNYEAATTAYQEAEQLKPAGQYQDFIQTKLKDLEEMQQQKEAEEVEQERLAEVAAAEKAEEERKQQAETARKAEEQRQENLNTYRQNRQEAFAEAKEAQEEATAATALAGVATGTAVAELIDLGISNNSDKNFYRGPSWHLGLSAGLDFTHMPMSINSESITYAYDGNYTTIIAESADNITEGVGGVGLKGSLTFAPILSNYFGLQGFVNGTYGIALANLFGGGTTTETDYGTSTSNTNLLYSNVTYGGYLSLGTKPIKLLGTYSNSHNSFDYSYSLISDTDDGYQVTTTEIYESNSFNFRENRLGLGLRLGAYAKRFTLDLLYVLAKPAMQDKSFPRIPVYQATLWWQSRCKLAVEYSPEYYAMGENMAHTANTQKMYLGLTLTYCKDYFGKSYSRK